MATRPRPSASAARSGSARSGPEAESRRTGAAEIPRVALRGLAGVLAGFAAGVCGTAVVWLAGGGAAWMAVYAYWAVFAYECVVYAGSGRNVGIHLAVRPLRLPAGGDLEVQVRARQGWLRWFAWTRVT
ncbi:MAG: hypothetical protein K6T30_07825, partial [Alicyclobacillus sp.]|nr:hypothetical protein [Alicyclobacillus sp.]